MKCRTLARIALPLISFDFICLIWSSNESLLSMIIPRYLAFCFSSMGTPFKTKFKFNSLESFFFLNKRALDFLDLD